MRFPGHCDTRYRNVTHLTPGSIQQQPNHPTFDTMTAENGLTHRNHGTKSITHFIEHGNSTQSQRLTGPLGRTRRSVAASSGCQIGIQKTHLPKSS